MLHKIMLVLLFLIQILTAQEVYKDLNYLIKNKEYGKFHIFVDSLLEKDNNNADLNLLKGRVLVDQFRLEESKPFLEKAVSFDKQNSGAKAWGLNYLAMIAYLDNDKEKCFQYLNTSLVLNAGKNAVKFAQEKILIWGFSDFYKDWEKQETEHFVFHFQPNSIITYKTKFMETRESAFQKISQFFDVSLQSKIDFYIWNSDAEAKEKGIYSVGFALPEFFIIHSKANQTPGHEVTHIISHYLSKDVKKIRFINEGIAVCFDCNPDTNFLKIKQIRETEKYNDKISIIDAWLNKSKYSDGILYPVAGEFVNRILEKGGKEKFLKLVVDQSLSNARALYGELLDDVIKQIELEIN
ncbi:MAG: hypothetical protein M0P61_08410 [Ignavibacteriaceae bacterium]|nr:hypothetical protein [Ignavibacteriaceae bacterium]